MKPLTSKKVSRLFTFGCSFTNYVYTVWPEIVANYLDVPYWNYALPGLGNPAIFSRFIQANKIHEFNENDLIMICWTEAGRDDRWDIISNNWNTGGNIYHTDTWNPKWLKRWGNSTHYLLRDAGLISSAYNILESLQSHYHVFSIVDFFNVDEVFPYKLPIKNKTKLLNMFESEIQKIYPSFYQVLWYPNMYFNKWHKDKIHVHPDYLDSHPRPLEHLQYLGHFFPEILSTQYQIVKEKEDIFLDFIRPIYDKKSLLQSFKKKHHAIQCITKEEAETLYELTLIRKSEPISDGIF